MNKLLVLPFLGLAVLGCTASKTAHPHGKPATAPTTPTTRAVSGTGMKATTAPVAMIPPTILRAVYVQQAPPIDGKLGSLAWRKCELQDLVGIGGQPTPLVTQASVVLDDKNLYVAWRCEEKNTAGLVFDATTQPGKEAWQDDCVELYISPDGGEYYHFIVNCKGTLSAAKGTPGGNEDTTWKSGAVAKVAVDKNTAWSVTLAIPLKDLSPKSVKDQTWAFNLNRTKPTGDDTNPYLEATWSRSGAHNYGDAKGWGKLTGVDVP